MGFEFEINGEDRLPGFLRSKRGEDGEIVRPSKTRIALQATFFFLTVALAIVKIVVGVNNTDNCQVEPMVPKFLIVSGSLTLIISVLRLIHTAAMLAWAKEKLSSFVAILEASSFTAFEFILSLASFCWFIAGSVYVFRVHEPDYIHPRLPGYCDEGTYKLAFYFLVITWALAALSVGICMLSCCCACCLAICGIGKSK